MRVQVNQHPDFKTVHDRYEYDVDNKILYNTEERYNLIKVPTTQLFEDEPEVYGMYEPRWHDTLFCLPEALHESMLELAAQKN